MDDEEPPSLTSAAAPAAPPAGAFAHGTSSSSSSSSGAVPPPAAFSRGGSTSPTPTPAAAAAADDLNARWKQHEQDMESRRNQSSLGGSAGTGSAGGNYKSNDDNNNPSSSSSSSYKLYETPEKTKPVTTASKLSDDIAPRRVYSFTKSTSYDTNELIKKYSGITGLAGSAVVHAPPSPSPSTSSHRSYATSSADRAVREEAMQVLDLVDEHLNSSFNVRRTESGGFRAAANARAPYHVRRTESGGVMVEHGGKEGNGEDSTKPYYVKRTSSGTVTDSAGRSERRTPAALAGLGLTRTMSNSSQRSHGSRGSRTSWKGQTGRYSFTDPNFRDDDYMSGDEDDIVTMARPHPGLGISKGSQGFQDEPMDSVRIDIGVRKSHYSDYPDGDGVGAGFGAGDFPGKSSAWSSRYNTTKNTTKMLDQWDTDYRSASERQRQSARNMFMSSAHNMAAAASSMGEAMASGSARVFGAGFSFRQKHTFGQQQSAGAKATGGPNLRTVWKDIEDDNDDMLPPGPRVHKTWQEVMLNKRRRRRILLSSICVVVAAIILGLTLSPSVNPKREQDEVFAGSGEGTTITFYATSDTPFGMDDEEKLAKDLHKIPNDAEFVMHLGNMQDAGVSLCPETHAAEAASILKKSPVPVMVIPGEHDWVKCPRQDDAYTRWMAAFGTFDQEFARTMAYARSASHPEVYVVLHKGVLFFGLHLVNGRVEDTDMLDFLNEDMKAFFIGMLIEYQDQYRAVVIMGNARPGPRQKAFFDSVSPKLNGIKAPIAYIHANAGSSDFVEHTPFDDLDILAIQVPKGGEHPPLKVTVGFGSRPFMVG
jgi:Calcineurin-like phosphoesterase